MVVCEVPLRFEAGYEDMFVFHRDGGSRGARIAAAARSTYFDNEQFSEFEQLQASEELRTAEE